MNRIAIILSLVVLLAVGCHPTANAQLPTESFVNASSSGWNATNATKCLAASELDLTRVCIVRAAKENAQQKMAADDLVQHLEQITGVKPVEGLAAAKGAATVFSFRRPKDAPGGRFVSVARREGNTIHFWGDDLPTRGGPQYGSGFAVAEFLERFRGVLWVRPGDEGIVFTRRTTCDVPADWRWDRPYPFYTSLVHGCDSLWGMRMK